MVKAAKQALMVMEFWLDVRVEVVLLVVNRAQRCELHNLALFWWVGGSACRVLLWPFWSRATLHATFKEFFWRWIGSSEPALAHHEECFGQMGKVGRSSRATIVNETFGLWLASGSGGGYRVSFCSDRRPFSRDGGDHVWSGVAQLASRRCPGTHDYGTRTSMDSRLLRRIRGTLLCLAASALCVCGLLPVGNTFRNVTNAYDALMFWAGFRRSFAAADVAWRTRLGGTR